jgi:hypothetical protein
MEAQQRLRSSEDAGAGFSHVKEYPGGMVRAAAKISLNHRQEVADASGGRRFLAAQQHPVQCLEPAAVSFSGVQSIDAPKVPVVSNKDALIL